MRPNFVLFVPDQLRAESLGCYGEALAPTPHIDRVAEGAVLFEQCHVQHTVCTPSSDVVPFDHDPRGRPP